MVNLKAKPFNLSDSDVEWVRESIAGMTAEEKVGQLFFQLTSGADEGYLRELVEKYHIGGCRYNPMPAAAVQNHPYGARYSQTSSESSLSFPYQRRGPDLVQRYSRQ